MLTDNLIKAELSYAYLYGVAAMAGFSVEHRKIDMDSIDCQVIARGAIVPNAVWEAPILHVQLKSSSELGGGEKFNYKLPIKNYTELSNPKRKNPAILMILDLPKKKSDWLSHSVEELVYRRCAYWLNLKGMPSTSNTATRTVSVSRRNYLCPSTLRTLMERIARDEELGNVI